MEGGYGYAGMLQLQNRYEDCESDDHEDAPAPVRDDTSRQLLKETAKKQKEIARKHAIAMERDRRAIEDALQQRRQQKSQFVQYIRPVEKFSKLDENEMARETSKKQRELMKQKERKEALEKRAYRAALEQRKREREKFNQYLHGPQRPQPLNEFPQTVLYPKKIIVASQPSQGRQSGIPQPQHYGAAKQPESLTMYQMAPQTLSRAPTSQPTSTVNVTPLPKVTRPPSATVASAIPSFHPTPLSRVSSLPVIPAVKAAPTTGNSNGKPPVVTDPGARGVKFEPPKLYANERGDDDDYDSEDENVSIDIPSVKFTAPRTQQQSLHTSVSESAYRDRRYGDDTSDTELASKEKEHKAMATIINTAINSLHIAPSPSKPPQVGGKRVAMQEVEDDIEEDIDVLNTAIDLDSSDQSDTISDLSVSAVGGEMYQSHEDEAIDNDRQRARTSLLASLDLSVALSSSRSHDYHERSHKSRSTFLQSLDLASSSGSVTAAFCNTASESHSDTDAAEVSRRSIRLLHAVRESSQLMSSAAFTALEELCQRPQWSPNAILRALDAPTTPQALKLKVKSRPFAQPQSNGGLNVPNETTTKKKSGSEVSSQPQSKSGFAGPSRLEQIYQAKQEKRREQTAEVDARADLMAQQKKLSQIAAEEIVRKQIAFAQELRNRPVPGRINPQTRPPILPKTSGFAPSLPVKAALGPSPFHGAPPSLSRQPSRPPSAVHVPVVRGRPSSPKPIQRLPSSPGRRPQSVSPRSMSGAAKPKPVVTGGFGQSPSGPRPLQRATSLQPVSQRTRPTVSPRSNAVQQPTIARGAHTRVLPESQRQNLIEEKVFPQPERTSTPKKKESRRPLSTNVRDDHLSVSTRERALMQSLARLDAELYEKHTTSHDHSEDTFDSYVSAHLPNYQQHVAVSPQMPSRAEHRPGDLAYKPRVRR